MTSLVSEWAWESIFGSPAYHSEADTNSLGESSLRDSIPSPTDDIEESEDWIIVTEEKDKLECEEGWIIFQHNIEEKHHLKENSALSQLQKSDRIDQAISPTGTLISTSPQRKRLVPNNNNSRNNVANNELLQDWLSREAQERKLLKSAKKGRNAK
eukprot:Awhi_evm1s13850